MQNDEWSEAEAKPARENLVALAIRLMLESLGDGRFLRDEAFFSVAGERLVPFDRFASTFFVPKVARR